MTEEIKEILEDIKNTEECSLSGKNALFLLDYITNLQQEKSDICKNRLAIAIERDRLQQENERLNNIINEVEKEIERERMEHFTPSPLYLTELLEKIKQLKESEK